MMQEQPENPNQNPLNDPEPPAEADTTPRWEAEEWKPGKWIVAKGQGVNRKINGPTFGNEATVFTDLGEAEAKAAELNEKESGQ